LIEEKKFQAYYQTYWSGRYKFDCEPINDYNDTSEFAMTVVNYCHLYFMIKVFDLLDTVFFVLRKKSSHLSFLHVYHHAGILLGSYVCTKYVPGGHATLLGIINSFVHAVMYFYYFMSAYKPEIKKSIFWKKQITHIQMVTDNDDTGDIYSMTNCLCQLSISDTICHFDLAFWTTGYFCVRYVHIPEILVVGGVLAKFVHAIIVQ
jgi:GNS1/SUR4 family